MNNNTLALGKRKGILEEKILQTSIFYKNVANYYFRNENNADYCNMEIILGGLF